MILPGNVTSGRELIIDLSNLSYIFSFLSNMKDSAKLEKSYENMVLYEFFPLILYLIFLVWTVKRE